MSENVYEKLSIVDVEKIIVEYGRDDCFTWPDDSKVDMEKLKNLNNIFGQWFEMD